MIRKLFKRSLSLLLALAMVLSMAPQITLTAHAASGSLTMSADGLTASYSGSGSWSGGGTTASGMVSGKNGFISALNSAQTATLTLKNGREKTANLTFSYNITKNTGSVTIGGTTVTGSGNYEATLDAGDTVQIVIKSGKGTSNTTAITLSDISLVVDSSATTTFLAPENGSYTVNGTAITAQTQMTQKSTEAYALVATPADGYKFIGWYSTSTGSYFSTSATATLNVETDTTVYPVFTGTSTAVFQVGLNLYTSFNEAINAASSGTAKQITLIDSGTLSAGEYTIPAGVKLLIPYDAANTASFGDETVCTMTSATPSMYSCLTLAEGAVINCYGDINVNAQQFASSAQYTGHVSGPYGAIHLESGAQLNMKSGSNLYAYGYIGGDGVVWAESGSNLYQLFQIRDWRGGSDSAALLTTLKNNSFLFSQYYFQNIEATLRLDSGCAMYGSAAIAAGLTTKSPNQTCAIILGKDSGMFHMTGGYATMKYDASTDRNILDFYGTLVTDSISLKMNLTGLVSSTMNTSDYILGLPMNYTINIHDGSAVTFAQKFKLLPGTVVNIEEGATATIAAAGALYLYDVDDWNAGNYAYNKKIFQLPYVYARKGAPVSRSVTDDAVLNLDGNLTANGPIYSTKNVDNGGNAGITGSGVFANNTYGSTNLKEVNNGGTNVEEVVCVPVVGIISGHGGQNSFGTGTAYQNQDGSWYQHTLTVDDNDPIYVAGTKDAHAEVTVESDLPCWTATNATVTKNEDGTFTISDFKGSARVTFQEHTPKAVEAKDPSCTDTGLTEGSVCSVCKTFLTAQETVPALGHTEEIIEGKEATCTETGLTEGKKCSVCDLVLEAQNTIPATGHTEAADAAVAATCTETGLTAGAHCTVCGEVTKAQEEVAALGHDHSVIVEGTALAATCTEDGKNADMQCVRCDDTVEGAVIPATGHSHTLTVEGSAKAPTCTEDGKELDLKCANCDDVKSGAVIPATGHDEVIVKGTQPTCTETGLSEGKTCATCGEILVAQEVLDALGHDYVAVITAPTCTDQGFTTYTCSRCGDSYVDDYTEIESENHVYAEETILVESTCTEEGYEAKVCSICSHLEKIEGTEKPFYGHEFEYGVLTPTCTEGGYTVRTCSVCGYSDTVDPQEKLGHDCVESLVYPTCTEQGYTQHDCSRCDYSHIPADTYQLALGHQFELALQPPTCLEDGYTHYECMDCGETYIFEESRVAATGHQYIPAVTDATCTEDGYTTYTCACGKSYIDDIVAATGHEYGEWTVTKGPNCTEDGEHEKTCAKCDDVVKEALAATGHSHTPVVTNPTCTEKGYTTYTCPCGDVYEDDFVDAKGHTEVIDDAVAATCTSTGLTEGKHCTVCGEVIVEQAVIEMLEHTYGEWVISKLASCSEAGEEARYCSVCHTAETRATDMLAHTVVTDPAVAARYDKSGLTEGSHCSACGTVIVEQQESPMLVLDWEHTLVALKDLEAYAYEYAASNPGKNATKLVINFLRTGVERYNDNEWVTMAGAAENVFIQEVLAKDDINGTIAYALREMDTLPIDMPNGQKMEFDHMYGALNVSSYTNYRQSNTDFGSWAGDLCDLLDYVVEKKYTVGEDLEAAVEEIRTKYFGIRDTSAESSFAMSDVYADLDAFYVVAQIKGGKSKLSEIFEAYYTENLTDVQRAAFFLNNRFPGKLTREEVREAVYTTYKDHLMVQLLEAGRDLSNQTELREVCCYAFADYLYECAKDSLVAPEIPDETPDEGEEETYIYKVFNSTASDLAPGVVQTVNYAMDGKGEQMVFYTATVDITRDDLTMYANYADNDPSQGWKMSTVSSQMIAAQNKHSNPDDPDNYIPNYNVVVGQNANFYNMSTGEPGGLFVMEGITYKTGGNFFAILKDGTPVIGTDADYAIYAEQIQEAVGGGQILVKDGANAIDPSVTKKMPRSCVGITADGKVVMLVVDGRQAGFSVGATHYEVAQMFVDAGCVQALELDGGGSATFDAKPEGSDEIVVVNRPNDMYERSVASSLIAVSTAVISNEFHHAVITTPTDYLTPGASFDIEMTGVSISGHPAEIPENAVLQLSDETGGTITGKTFKADARGKAEIQLVVDGEVVGTKAIEVIRRPDALRFSENNLNAIYGEVLALPIVATYQNNRVTITRDDLIFELSNELAGTVNGFAFIGSEESGVRNVTVTAKVRTDVNITAKMSLRLYNKDESIFDFDNATQGRESLAWNRVVSNAFTRDDVHYYVTDPDSEVHADYTFALDMKAIKAPARLQPLMEYLNGFAGNVGDDASPWDYMLALGNRVSPLTNVTIKTYFPEGVAVNIDDIAFVNDFMSIKDHSYDESTRMLTITCGWNKQSSEEGIDPSTANSIAILSGVKLIPDKDAIAKGQLNIDVTGDVTYDIYLDTSQLHSFAQDPANQEKYGIYDYINPDDSEDAGGHFSDTYITFEDHFTIHNQALVGWVTGGTDNDLHYYYNNNVMATGVCAAPDMNGSSKVYYYDFGEDGICKGIYTGLFYDEAKGGWCYSKLGELATGWQTINGNWHYFLVMKDGVAATGTMKIAKPGVTFEFDEQGMTKGAWVKTDEGMRYCYGPGYHKALNPGYLTLVEIDDKTYNFDYDGNVTTGILALRQGASLKKSVYEFDADGVMIRQITTQGTVECVDATYYINEYGYVPMDAGLVKCGEDYYYVYHSGKIAKGSTLNITEGKVNGYFASGWYTFDDDGEMIKPGTTEIKNIDGVDYYYMNGKVGKNAGLVKVGEYYYFVYYSGKIAKGSTLNITADKTNGHFPAGWYPFADDGRMITPTYTGLVTLEGIDYYYLNGKLGKDAGLVQIGEEYYYVYYSGKIARGSTLNITEDKMNGHFAPGWYVFLADGRMVTSGYTGLVTRDGKDYYYINGQIGKDAGLVKVDDDYYFVSTSGLIRKDTVWSVTAEKANGYVDAGKYVFGTDGKMVRQDTACIMTVTGQDYYYANGKIGENAGLVKIGEDYYYILSNGTVYKNGTLTISANKLNGFFTPGKYTFGPDGKMDAPFTGIMNVDGVDYYYLNGQIGKNAGVVKVDDAYYFVYYSGKIAKGSTLHITADKTNGHFDTGWYDVAADGKISDPNFTGIKTVDGIDYYYRKGKIGKNAGAVQIGDDYYFVYYSGKIAKGSTLNITADKTNGHFAAGWYVFEADGKMINPYFVGIKTVDGIDYYYANGKVGKDAGLVNVGGDFYYVYYSGKIAKGSALNITADKTNGHVRAGWYTFEADGRMMFY